MPNTQTNRKRKYRFAAPIGGGFVALAALGVATIIFLSFRLTGTMLDNSAEKKRFEDIIRPVVLFNPAPFETPTDIPQDSLLQYSMWATLLGEKRDTFPLSEASQLVVPATDLDVSAARLFGSEVKLEHKSFGDYETSYYYDEDNAVYNVPMAVLSSVYTPYVETVEKDGEFLKLTVGFVPSGVTWKTDFSGTKEKPAYEKLMIFMMAKSKNSYTIAKLQDLPGQGTEPQTALTAGA